MWHIVIVLGLACAGTYYSFDYLAEQAKTDYTPPCKRKVVATTVGTVFTGKGVNISTSAGGVCLERYKGPE